MLTQKNGAQKHLRGVSVDAAAHIDLKNKLNHSGTTKNARDQSVRLSKFNGTDEDLTGHSINENSKGNEIDYTSASHNKSI